MNIVITGGAGFLGARLARALLAWVSAKVAGYRASAGRIGLAVDNFLTVFS
jgi:nucleoside-diphosphate-sugar epimerase